MRYASIDNYDIANGQMNGVSIYVQGCHFRCPNCFNPETHDFNGGKEWNKEAQEDFLKLAARPYIKRISILGGEPLTSENVDDVLKLVNEIRLLFPEKKIWLFTGYTWDEITMAPGEMLDSHNGKRFKRHLIIEQCDVIVDGRYVDELRDLTLMFRGSSNQRVIDVKKSIEKGEVVLWLD